MVIGVVSTALTITKKLNNDKRKKLIASFVIKKELFCRKKNDFCSN
jgi:hypothetical protein